MKLYRTLFGVLDVLIGNITVWYLIGSIGTCSAPLSKSSSSFRWMSEEKKCFSVDLGTFQPECVFSSYVCPIQCSSAFQILLVRIQGFFFFSDTPAEHARKRCCSSTESRGFARRCHDSSEVLIIEQQADDLLDLECHFSPML